MSDAREAAAWFRRRTFASTDDASEVAGLLEGRRVSVVLPARDEESTIGPIVTSIRKRLVDEVGLVHEIIVVDSRSSDATAESAARAGAMVYRVGPRGSDGGKGGAMQTGLARMSGDVGVYLDADIEDFDPAFVVRLLDRCCATRHSSWSRASTTGRHPGVGVGASPSWSRVPCSDGSSRACSGSPSRSPGSARSSAHPC